MRDDGRRVGDTKAPAHHNHGGDTRGTEERVKQIRFNRGDNHRNERERCGADQERERDFGATGDPPRAHGCGHKRRLSQ